MSNSLNIKVQRFNHRRRAVLSLEFLTLSEFCKIQFFPSISIARLAFQSQTQSRFLSCSLISQFHEIDQNSYILPRFRSWTQNHLFSKFLIIVPTFSPRTSQTAQFSKSPDRFHLDYRPTRQDTFAVLKRTQIGYPAEASSRSVSHAVS